MMILQVEGKFLKFPSEREILDLIVTNPGHDRVKPNNEPIICNKHDLANLETDYLHGSSPRVKALGG